MSKAKLTEELEQFAKLLAKTALRAGHEGRMVTIEVSPGLGLQVADLVGNSARYKHRLEATAEVGCVKTWGKLPMRCLPKDPCSFCRARALLDTTAEGA